MSFEQHLVCSKCSKVSVMMSMVVMKMKMNLVFSYLFR